MFSTARVISRAMINHEEPDNPFATEVDINLYANRHAVASSGISCLPSEPADYNHHGVSVGIPLNRGVDLKQKERELRAKEAELNRREEIVRQREEALAKAGVTLQEKNWPPFFPIIHHDIANEIPPYLQKVQYVAFATFLGVPVCLLWNLIALTAQWAKGGDGRVFFLAIIYILAGVPGAYFLWYRPLYRVLRIESGLKFTWFFFFYVFHIIVFVYAAIAPPIIYNGLYFTGIFTAVEIIPKHPLIGILYFIGFGLFAVESLVSIWVLQQVYRYFRGSGQAAQMKRRAAPVGMATSN